MQQNEGGPERCGTGEKCITTEVKSSREDVISCQSTADIYGERVETPSRLPKCSTGRDGSYRRDACARIKEDVNREKNKPSCEELSTQCGGYFCVQKVAGEVSYSHAQG